MKRRTIAILALVLLLGLALPWAALGAPMGQEGSAEFQKLAGWLPAYAELPGSMLREQGYTTHTGLDGGTWPAAKWVRTIQIENGTLMALRGLTIGIQPRSAAAEELYLQRTPGTPFELGAGENCAQWFVNQPHDNRLIFFKGGYVVSLVYGSQAATQHTPYVPGVGSGFPATEIDISKWIPPGDVEPDGEALVLELAREIAARMPASDSGWQCTPGTAATSITRPGSGAAAGRQAAAAAAAGILTTLLAILLILNQGAYPWTRAAAPAAPPEQGGKVWFQPPWEKAGPFWMDRKAYEFVQRMQAEGRVWSDTYGWQMPADLAQYERQRAAQRAQYTATPQAQARATRLRAQIEEEQRLAQQGHVTALDMAQLKLWVLKHAPSAQVTGDMLTLVERMTVQAQSGARVGNVEQIRQALGQELERTNQPHLSYWERYAEMEERRSTPLQDARDLSRDVTGGLATYTEIKKVPLSPRYQKLPGAVGWVANADKALQYYQGYRQQDLSRTQAAGRALLQTGVQYFVTKNPAIGLVDTGLKYGGQLTAGKDLSPSRGYEVMINALLDGRKLTASQQAASLDFSSPQMQEMIRGSQQQAVEQALASGRLSPGDREALLQLRETLHS